MLAKRLLPSTNDDDDNLTKMPRLQALYPTAEDSNVNYVEWAHLTAPDALCEFLLTNSSDAVSVLDISLCSPLLTSHR